MNFAKIRVGSFSLRKLHSTTPITYGRCYPTKRAVSWYDELVTCHCSFRYVKVWVEPLRIALSEGKRVSRTFVGKGQVGDRPLGEKFPGCKRTAKLPCIVASSGTLFDCENVGGSETERKRDDGYGINQRRENTGAGKKPELMKWRRKRAELFKTT